MSDDGLVEWVAEAMAPATVTSRAMMGGRTLYCDGQVFAIIGDDSIGRGIVDTLSGHRSRAVLMQNHGPFTIGTSARDAVKAAVMLEDVARTVHIAAQAGPLIPIPQEAIDSLYDRYQNVYGQSTGDKR